MVRMANANVWLAMFAALPLLASAQGIDCNIPGASSQALKGMNAMFKAQKVRQEQRMARLDEIVQQKMQLSHWTAEQKSQFFAQLVKTQRFAQLQNDIDVLGPSVNAALNDVQGLGTAGSYDNPTACRRILDVFVLFNQVDAAADRQIEYMASQVKAAD